MDLLRKIYLTLCVLVIVMAMSLINVSYQCLLLIYLINVSYQCLLSMSIINVPYQCLLSMCLKMFQLFYLYMTLLITPRHDSFQDTDSNSEANSKKILKKCFVGIIYTQVYIIHSNGLEVGL